MSASLMEALQGLVTPAMLKTATATLGESESALTSGLGGIVSKILNALVAGAGDSALMNTVAGLVTAQSRDQGTLADVTGLLSGSMPTATGSIAGNQLIGALFGVREGGVAQAAAATAGLKPQSGAALMALAGPLVLSALAKTPNAGSLTGTALSSLLNTERAAISGVAIAAKPAAPVPAPAAAPAPAPVLAPAAVAQVASSTAAQTAAATAAVAGAAATAARNVSSTVANVASTAAGTASSTGRAAASEVIRPTAATAGGAGLSWLLWFVPLIVLGVLGWFAWQNQQAFIGDKPKAVEPVLEKKSQAPAAAPQLAAVIPAAAPVAAPEPAPIVAVDADNGMLKLALMGGTSITYAQDGVEGELVSFLQDANSVIDKKTWFDFDRLNFETGSTNLTAESREQVNNIAAVLKAFPTSAIKIGGYTDNVGNPDSNLKLSDERAKKVMNELVALGVTADRLDAEGYGEQFPVAENDTDEGRSKNRRTALSVRAR